MRRTENGDRADILAEKSRAASASVAAGALLTVLKLAAALGTGSLGLLAEAAHSALDLGAALITWFAVRTSWRPPDEDHHYGHGKVENLSAFVETALLVLTAGWILYEAAQRLAGGGPHVEPNLWAFLVLLLSMAVDFVRSRDLRKVARKSGSQALEADALHFSTDIGSSAVVILGLAGATLADRGGPAWLRLADPVAAVVVALVVLHLSWNMGRRAADVLLDRAPEQATRRVQAALAGLSELQGASPRLRVREAGDRVFVDVEVPLEAGRPVAEGERIAGRIRERLRRELGPSASILVQLKADRDPSAGLRERITTAAAMEGHAVHNVTVRRRNRGYHADLHLELPPELRLDHAHDIADQVERRIRDEVPELERVDIHIEQHHPDPETIEEPSPEEKSRLEATVRRVAEAVAGPCAAHDVLVGRLPSGLYLSFHCFLPREASLEQAHRITDELEEKLRAALPDLVRVAIHVEPEGHHR